MRAKGAGFYQFSGDDETRQRQMEELRSVREETAKSRQNAGAVNIRPGDVEGMQAEGSKSMALEKRKREIEERRKLLDAKRRRKMGGNDEGKGESDPPSTTPQSGPSYTVAIQPSHPSSDGRSSALQPLPSASDKTKDLADEFLAKLERDMLNQKGP